MFGKKKSQPEPTRDHRGAYDPDNERADGRRDEGTRVGDDRHDKGTRVGDRHDDGETHRGAPTARDEYEYRHGEHGGAKFGAIFYGWLVAIAFTILLIGIVGAIAAAVGSSMDVTTGQAELEAGSIGIASAITVLVILMIGYFAGGYVAGRLARFDGGRQGIGVWVFGLLVTIIVAVLGAVFGSEYNVLERVQIPSVPVPTDQLSMGGVITLAAVVVGTILAAFLGGKVGQRYHSKIDRTRV